MGFDFVGRRPAHHVETEHFMGALGRLAAGPQGNHQTGDDRTIALNFDPVLVVAQEMTASQEVLELPEEDLDCPSVRI